MMKKYISYIVVIIGLVIPLQAMRSRASQALRRGTYTLTRTWGPRTYFSASGSSSDQPTKYCTKNEVKKLTDQFRIIERKGELVLTDLSFNQPRPKKRFYELENPLRPFHKHNVKDFYTKNDWLQSFLWAAYKADFEETKEKFNKLPTFSPELADRTLGIVGNGLSRNPFILSPEKLGEIGNIVNFLIKKGATPEVELYEVDLRWKSIDLRSYKHLGYFSYPATVIYLVTHGAQIALKHLIEERGHGFWISCLENYYRDKKLAALEQFIDPEENYKF